MNLKERIDEVWHETPESRLDERKILSQLKEIMSFRLDCDLPSAVILRSRMNKTSVKEFLHDNLGVNVQDVRFLPYAISSGEMTYQVKLS